MSEFGDSVTSQINQANQEHCINYTALLLILIQRGVISAEEYATARIQASHLVEQEFARRQEQLARDFSILHRGMDLFSDLLGN